MSGLAWRPPGLVIVGLLALGVLSWNVFAQPPSSANVSDEVNWDQVLQVSGVDEVLQQANFLIDQEIRNLEKTPLGFDSNDLLTLQQSFREQLGSEQLKQAIVADLQRQFSASDIRQLQSILRSKELQQLQQLQARLEKAEVRKAIRSYKVKIRETAPSSNRLELLASLDELLRQSSMETALKVQLRKQLLATVSQMKTKQVFTEEMLDEQLMDYRQEVEAKISENALHAYLYLLKRTPSSRVRDLLVSLDEPVFDAYMDICLRAMEASFLKARQRLQDKMQLAEG